MQLAWQFRHDVPSPGGGSPSRRHRAAPTKEAGMKTIHGTFRSVEKSSEPAIVEPVWNFC
jgi:hypothetical protein